MCETKLNTAIVDLDEYMSLLRFKEEQLTNNKIVVENHSSDRCYRSTVYYTTDEVIQSLTEKYNNSLSTISELMSEVSLKEFNLRNMRDKEKLCIDIETLSFWEFFGIKWKAFKNRF